MNLQEKLVEVRKKAPYLKKDSKGHNCDYVKESTLFGMISEAMNDLKLLLTQEVLDMQSVEINIPVKDGIKTITGIRVKFQYTWTDAEKPEEKIVNLDCLQDTKADVQACGGLKTYGMRYYLLKFFNVPTDKDDPDKFDEKMKKLFGGDEATDLIPEEAKKISKENVTELEEELKGYHEIKNIVLRRFECKELKELPLMNFGEILLGIKQMKATQLAKAAK